MLIQKFQNFAHSSLNSQITQINTNIEHIYLTNKKKIQKTCWGCLRKSRLVSKKLSRKMDFFYKRDILRKDPQIAKKVVQTLKNINLQIFSFDFSNVDNVYWGDLSKILWIRKWKWHFAFKWSWFFSKMKKKLFPSSHCSGPIVQREPMDGKLSKIYSCAKSPKSP